MNRRARRRAARATAAGAAPPGVAQGGPAIASLLAAAVERHAAGDLAEAEPLYRSVLARRPDHGDALRLLGVLCRHRGADGEAARLLRRAVAARPGDALAKLELARLELDRDGTAVAERLARAAVALAPDLGEAHATLGAVLMAQGRARQAEDAARRAIAADPDFAAARDLLGRALQAQAVDPGGGGLRRAELLFHHDRLTEALAAYDAALAAGDDATEAQLGRGRTLLGLGRHAAARAAFERVLVGRPGSAVALVYLGNALYGEGRLAEALDAYRRAVSARPRFANAHYNVGVALEALDRFVEAAEAFARVTRIEPANAAARVRRGACLHRAGAAGARTALEEALAAVPDDTEVLAHLATLRRNRGEAEAAIALYRRALAVDPDLPRLHSALLVALHCATGVGAAEIAAEHRAWARRHAGTRPTHPRPRDPDPGRRLRVGYVSPDFRSHSVAQFIAPVIAAHDRAAVEVTCYADLARPDAVTESLRADADIWHDVSGLDDAALAARVRADGIDILVDLAGHMEANRLGAFAHRPAPVQVTWIGYPGTTGLATMDYRLTDAIADPPGAEAHHVETLIRLATGFLCWRPPAGAPAVGPLPSAAPGATTFASFATLAKLGPTLIATWAEVLKAVPQSILMLKDRGLGDRETCAHLIAAFAAHGIRAERLALRDWQRSKADHLASYGAVDVALDTFPYNGTATTCEALWMGVPVVTLAGDRHAARVGASLLSTVGLADLVATDAASYVSIAAGLAAEPARLARLRAEMRRRMTASPLMDAAAFTRRLEAAYRDLWRRCCTEGA